MGGSTIVKDEINATPLHNSDNDGSDENELGSPVNEDGSSKPAAPLQKRRRVTRACDECRRKKIKCDGKQPCTHCSVYSYECTYDQPSNRRRNATPQYIEALEQQLKRAKALLNTVFPNNEIDLNDPTFEAQLENGVVPPVSSAGSRPTASSDPSAARPKQLGPDDSQIESMIRSTGQLDLDEQGYWDYHGRSSGLSFMRRMGERFKDIIGPAGGEHQPFVQRSMSVVLDSPKSAQGSPFDGTSLVLTPGGPDFADLPSKERARQLCDNALYDATSILRVVHIPSFYENFEKVFNKSPENFGNEENKFLPLLYSVLALGSLFSRSHSEMDTIGYENAIDSGLKYFKAARQLLDIADLRDLISLQATVFMILFLQASSKLSVCYCYIGVALRSALRMGLHRSFDNNFDPIEAETRKRLFWLIRKMDIYVGAMLGLPLIMSNEDIDQDYPTEVDDECITRHEILSMPEGEVSIAMASFNAHTDLTIAMQKIIRYIYPMKPTTTIDGGSYSVSLRKVREIETDLERWRKELPSELRPGGDASKETLRAQQLLRLSYAHVQMLLYRPFLHYVSQEYQTKSTDSRAFACASACVSVARNIVHITVEMNKRELLIGAYWFIMYTTFFAIMSMIYFVLENPDNPTAEEVMRDAKQGADVLASLAKRSMAADRSAGTLKVVFEQFDRQLKFRRNKLTQVRKRRHESPHPTAERDSDIEPTIESSSMPHRASTDTLPKSHNNPLTNKTLQNRFAQAGLDLPMQNSPHTSISDRFDTPGLTDTPTSVGSGFSRDMAPSTSSALPNSQDMDSSVNAFPDMSAMMFSSSDPFAYPRQGMTTFENSSSMGDFQDMSFMNFATQAPKDQEMNMNDMSQENNIYDMAGTNSPLMPADQSNLMNSPDLDVRLFGTTPMYVRPQQGQNQNQNTNLQGQQFFHPNQQPTPASSSENMQNQINPQAFQEFDGNFDNIFTGNEWAAMMNQGLGFGDDSFRGAGLRFN